MVDFVFGGQPSTPGVNTDNKNPNSTAPAPPNQTGGHFLEPSFAFGGATTPAPTTSTSAQPNSGVGVVGAFSFGGNTTAATSAATAAPASNNGAGPPVPAAPPGSTTDPPAATPSFGSAPPASAPGLVLGQAAATANPAPGDAIGGSSTNSSAPTASAPGGISFNGTVGGGSTTTNAAPTAGGFLTAGSASSNANQQNGRSSSTTTSADTVPAGNTTNAAPVPQHSSTAPPSYIAVPEFSTAFPGFRISQRIHQNVFEYTDLETLLQVKTVWNQHTGNPAIRQKLHQQRIVLLTSQSDPNKQEEAILNDEMLQELFSIADDLALTEEQALSLLAKSKQQSKLSPETIYWNERKEHLETLLYMFQKRLALDENQTRASEQELVVSTNDLLGKGLIRELLQLISGFSHRLDRLIEQRRRHNAETVDVSARARQSRAFSMHIEFASKQRQMAAETLFFIAYNFRLETRDEIVPLIQLIRRLSNGDENNLDVSPGLRPRNPYIVPSAHIDRKDNVQQQPQAMWMEGLMPPHQAQLEEKNPFVWQNELVQQNWDQGHPQLLRCVATLLMTAVSALDQRASLQDRVTGNVFVSTDESTNLLLSEIHAVLYMDQWKTPHILGLLLASYAIVLHSTNNVALASPLSPRTGQSSPFHIRAGASPNTDVRRTFRHALEAPAVFKTFSFTRLSLIAALQIPVSPSSLPVCNVSEFLLAVLTDHTAQFFGLLLQRNPPISRAKWEQDAEEDLRLRRANLENYRQFQSWSGTRTALEVIPDSVDLLLRPDCMDDVLALCFDVCRLGSNFAASFWTQHDISDVFSQIEKMQRQDDSLLPGFLDLLSSLSFHAPDIVHLILSDEGSLENGASTTVTGVNTGRIALRWATIFETIRYYARELVNKGKGSGQNSTSGTDSSALDQSTEYYYFSSDRNTATSNSASNSSSSSSTVRELGEANTLILSSHLMLVEAVARSSVEARSFLRKLTLPIVSTESAVGQDSLWMILFSLTSAPVSPELRGLVFEALASIVDGSELEDIKQAWSCVEDYGILPIDKLLVYTNPIPGGIAPRISFPPSSTARVNEKHCTSWIPADPSYALIYEMEYIEASRGVYPSTSGFLRLLRELIQCGGCPADLGRNWRSLSGCTPYVLYVINLVLPRATGTFKGFPSLPFRCSGDKDRLLSLGFDVVATCLRRYVLPDFIQEQEPTVEKSLCQMQKDALDLFTVRSLVDRLVVSTNEEEFKTYTNDFLPAASMGESATDAGPSNGMILNSGLPKPKSPGFLILCELLNRTGSVLLEVIRKVVDEGMGQAADVDQYLAALAVYGATPPTISSAKAGHTYALKNLLLPLRTMDYMNVQKAFSSRQNRIVGLLETLCSAACREKQFAAALSKFKGSAAVVPIVKFQNRPSAPVVTEVQASVIGQLLNYGKCLQSIVEFAGYSSDDVHAIDIARASSCFLIYLDEANQSLPQSQPLFDAISNLIDYLSAWCEGQNESAELLQVFLSRCLIPLRARKPTLLLNIPILDVIVTSLICVLNRGNLLKQAPTVAATCYEVLCHAMHFSSGAETLVVQGFWTTHLGSVWKRVSESGDAGDVWYSVSWILAGLAEELNYLGSSGSVPLASGETYVVRPEKYNQIINLLFQDQILESLVGEIPFSNPRLSESMSRAVHLLIGATILSSCTFRNPIQMTSILQILLNHLETTTFAPTTRNLSLAVLAATDFQFAIADEDSLNYVNSLSSHIARGGEAGIVASATLANVLRRSVIPGNEFPQHSVLHACSILVRISCVSFDKSSVPVQPTPEALIARACLMTVLPNMEEHLVQRILTDHGDFGQSSTALAAWISLLAGIDGDIVSVLKLISNFSFGSDMLLDGDILRALDMVGERIAAHMQSLESTNVQPARIGVPIYLQGHLELMSVLLLRASHTRQIEASNQVMRILYRYEPAAEKLLMAFPSDGDTTVAYVKCCAIAFEKAGSKQLTIPSSSPRVPAVNTMSTLSLHILENPLPRTLLGSIPAALGARTMKDALVTIVPDEQTSWWDSLGSIDWDSHHTLLVFNGIKAAEIARLGISMIRAGDMAKKNDCLSIARCLCRNVDATKMLTSIENKRLASETPRDPRPIEEHRRFKQALCESVFEVLHLAIVVLRSHCESHQASTKHADWIDLVKPIQIALDHTLLGATGLGLCADENTLHSMNGVVTVLRKLIAEN